MPETHAPHPVALRGDAHRVAELLETAGALIDGHFRLLAGMHTGEFFRFSAIARNPHALDEIADWLAPELLPLSIDAVFAPTTAGVGLGWTLANSLGASLHLATLDDHSRPSGILGEPDLRGERLLLVNDVVTTGHGLGAMAELATARGADVAGACWFLTRSEVDAQELLGIPCFPVAQWHLPAWEPAACEACAAGDEPQPVYDLN